MQPPLDRLREIAHRYAAAVDDGRILDAVDLFAPDGELVLPDPPQQLLPSASHRGHEAIDRALRATLDLEATLHELTGQVIDLGPNGRARGRTTAIAHHYLPGAKDLTWRLRYDDEYAVVGGRWVIARRRLTVLAIELAEVRTLLPRGLGRTATVTER